MSTSLAVATDGSMCLGLGKFEYGLVKRIAGVLRLTAKAISTSLADCLGEVQPRVRSDHLPLRIRGCGLLGKRITDA